MNFFCNLLSFAFSRCRKVEGGSVIVSVNLLVFTPSLRTELLTPLRTSNPFYNISIAMDGLSTPPHIITSDDDYRTPQDLQAHDLNGSRDLFSYFPPPSYSPIVTLRNVRMYHTSYCPEGGLCKRFKGLIEDQPKGLYCCANIACSHQQVKRLKPHGNKLLIYDMMNSILLGETSPHIAVRVLEIIRDLPAVDL